MSVCRVDYIVYGWKLPYTIKNKAGEEIDMWCDKFLSMIEGHQGEEFTIIIGSKDTIFGLKLKSSGPDGWDFVELDLSGFEQSRVIDKFKNVFGFEPETQPGLFIFSHFS